MKDNRILQNICRYIYEVRYHTRKSSDDVLLKKVKKYKDIHHGERCFILGNGPSINDVDFSRLKDEYTFSVNQLPRNVKYKELSTTYHLWTDALFFDITTDNSGDCELLEVMKQVNSENNKPTVFYEISAKPMIQRNKLDEIIDIEYIKQVNMNVDIMLRKPLDFSHSVPNMPTVVHAAICLAVYMGFKQIYLLGCDCTGFINCAKSKMKQSNDVLYGYSVSELERERMERVTNRRTIRDELQSFVFLFDLYEKLYVYCKNNGVELFNATKGGLLDSMPRVNLDDILK